MTSVLSSADDGTRAAEQAAAGLERFADSITALRSRVEGLRSQAAGAGLTLTATSIVAPARPLALPPTPGEAATPAEARAFASARAARDLAVDRQSAFAEAEAQMSDVQGDLDAAVLDLDRVVADVQTLMIPAIDFITGAGLGVLYEKGAAAMRGHAAHLAETAAKARTATTLPGAALTPDLFYDDLDRAGRLTAQSQAVADDATRLVRVGKAAGWIVGGALTGVSIYQDVQAGESTAQAITSNGVGFLAAAASGAAAGAGIGTLVGTVLPGPGNAIGLVAGAVIGGAVGIATSGAIDSIFENGWDIGAALENGWNDLADTGMAVGDLAVQGWTAAGEAISAAGDGLSDAWDSIFG